MIQIKTDKTEKAFIATARTYGIKLAPLSKYFIERSSDHSYEKHLRD